MKNDSQKSLHYEGLNVRAVLLPLRGVNLLLPNAAVSEVISYKEPEEKSRSASQWLLGSYVWRQQIIPLIQFEVMASAMMAKARGQRSRVAVVNTLNGSEELPYVGLVLNDIPHLVRVHEDIIQPVKKPRKLGECVARQVTLSGEEAWIPDLDVLEKLVKAQVG